MFVAEFTTNHMGNLNLLLRMVTSAKQSGADLIKMQKKDVENFYSAEKLACPYDSPYGKTYRDYRTIFEFSDEDLFRFDAKCKEENIGWFTTVQDIASLNFMLKYDLPIYKVASSNARNKDLLKEVSQSLPITKELVISVAGCTLRDIEQSINIFPNHNIFILHCVAEYPCKYSNLRLGNIKILKSRFEDNRIKIGYSGHEIGILPSLAAADLGASMIERHFCVSRKSFVHHIECSLEPQEFSQMVSIINSKKDLRDFYYSELPKEAFDQKFEMSDIEKNFLVNQTYGNNYLDDKSKM